MFDLETLKKVLYSVQNWRMSIEKAIDVLFGKAEIEEDLNVIETKDCMIVICDEIPDNWPNGLEYGISDLRPGDKILVLRKTN